MCWCCNLRNTYPGPTDNELMMLRRKSRPGLTEVQRHILASAATRGDWKAYDQFLLDWGKIDVVNVSKFVPGDHFYVGNVKFDTLAEAKKLIAEEGNVFGELVLRYVYKRGGD